MTMKIKNCSRCGYGLKVPDWVADNKPLRNCPKCRTPEENSQRLSAFTALKLMGKI
jgi:predicted nucleic-acid-binding Zn-ribbon protein